MSLETLMLCCLIAHCHGFDWVRYPQHGIDWGDFHVFAVIFFTFLGGILAVGTIVGALYFAIGRPFLNRFRQEVAQTHREYHPWPIGSARWRLQQYIRTGRSAQTQFPTKPRPDEYANVSHQIPYKKAQDREPIIHADYPFRAPSQTARSIGSGKGYLVERPTYFTPTPDKSLAPVREEIEEYRITREESCISGGSEANTCSVEGVRVIRSSGQKGILPDTYI